jgi:Rod binding domain-containing protein
MSEVNGISAANRFAEDGMPRNIHQAAESFEALFLGNLLKSAREARDSGAIGEGDQASGSLMDMAEEFLAQELVKGGGCGLARMVLQQMEQRGALNATKNESPSR